jgi:23S rRNA (cytidine1920-2'-O)/16S rRNA (cytidine1409-2'-O)-methyltransferase
VSEQSRKFVSRAGVKLEHALDMFDVDVNGLVCADFGCNVGGFTDCLLQRGARLIYAIDTGYGTLAYKLRTDPRVVVMERTNALHAEPTGPHASAEHAGVDLVTIDLAWTPQRHAVPAALRWLRPADRGPGGPLIITLIKPHYELTDDEKRTLLDRGHLPEEHAERVLVRVLGAMRELGADVLSHTRSPITGGKSSRRSKGGGNIEYLALLCPMSRMDPMIGGTR